MSFSEAAFLVIGGVGFCLMLGSFIFGEVEHELEVSHEIEADHDYDADGYMPSVFSLKVVASAMVGFGASGYVSASVGLPALISWPFALCGMFAFAAFILYCVLKPLAKQQSNSLLSTDSYKGLVGRVTLGIMPGDFGQVRFQDRNGALVSVRATAIDAKATLPVGSEVFIVDVNKSGVTVMPSTISKEETE